VVRLIIDANVVDRPALLLDTVSSCCCWPVYICQMMW